MAVGLWLAWTVLIASLPTSRATVPVAPAAVAQTCGGLAAEAEQHTWQHHNGVSECWNRSVPAGGGGSDSCCHGSYPKELLWSLLQREMTFSEPWKGAAKRARQRGMAAGESWKGARKRASSESWKGAAKRAIAEKMGKRQQKETIAAMNHTTSDLAIIGNGPLLDSHREEIKRFPAEQVFRMNAMNNLMEGEPVGHLYANACSRGYWGVTSLVCPKIKDVIDIVLFGEQGKAEETILKLRKKHGPKVFFGLADGHEFQLQGRRYVTEDKNGGFSIGFKGIAYTRMRYPKAKIHVYGMNWSPPKLARGHPFMLEAQAIRHLDNVQVHPTMLTKWHGGGAFVCTAAFESEKVNLSTAQMSAHSSLGEAASHTSSDARSLWAGEHLSDDDDVES